MYELMVLGMLSQGPKHGYLIAKIIGDIIGPFRRVQWGALYPVLSKLEAEGLIAGVACAQGEDGRNRKVYDLTPQGHERLHELLMDTTRHLAEYEQIFRVKVAYFSRLNAQERLYLARHYFVYAQQNLDHLQREREDLVENHGRHIGREYLADILLVMDHRIDHWRRECAWAEELIERQTLVEVS